MAAFLEDLLYTNVVLLFSSFVTVVVDSVA